MKKSFFVLPLITLALAACSNSSTETTGAEVTSTGVPSWSSPDLQATPMPSSMSQPTYQPAPMPSSMSQTAPKPTPQPVYNAPQPSNQTAGEMVGNCNVVRGANGAPIYAQMQKGCYTSDVYTVGKSDTVFLIAFLAGKPVSEIARLNNLSQPYQLKTGQQLRLR